MPSWFSYCPHIGNELYQSPSSKDFTCSSLTSRDYRPLSGDSMPVHQDLTPVNPDSMPVHQDLTPTCQDFMPVCQDSTPFYQDLMPAYQDLPLVKHVCGTSDSVSEVYKPFSSGLVSLLHDKSQQ